MFCKLEQILAVSAVGIWLDYSKGLERLYYIICSNLQLSCLATVMAWDIRTERQSAKKRRLKREAQREKEEKMRLDREKNNSIDQYLLSGDEQVNRKRAIHSNKTGNGV